MAFVKKKKKDKYTGSYINVFSCPEADLKNPDMSQHWYPM